LDSLQNPVYRRAGFLKFLIAEANETGRRAHLAQGLPWENSYMIETFIPFYGTPKFH
jgi:hypothetical protein